MCPWNQVKSNFYPSLATLDYFFCFFFAYFFRNIFGFSGFFSGHRLFFGFLSFLNACCYLCMQTKLHMNYWWDRRANQAKSTKTEGKLDRDFRETKETLENWKSGGVMSCYCYIPSSHNLSLVVGLWWSNVKFLRSHLNSLESQKTKTRKTPKTRKYYGRNTRKRSRKNSLNSSKFCS